MTSKKALMFALLLFAPALFADRGPAVPDYPAEEVAPGVRVIHGPVGYPTPENLGFMNNPAFIVGETGVVVVDPGSSVQTGEMVLRQIAKITDKPVLAVINTHVHGDHWLGNQAIRAALPKVPIYGHPKMISLIQAGAGNEWIQRMLTATDGATRGTEVVPPNYPMEDGDEIQIDGNTYRFHYYGQVHSHTDLMIDLVEKGVLFLGDNANNGRIVRMDDGSFSNSVRALGTIKEVSKAQVLVPGHGRTGGWEIVDAYRDYLSGVRDGVAALYEEGVSDFDMKPRISEQLARFKDWVGFEDEIGKHISLAYLEVESEAF